MVRSLADRLVILVVTVLMLAAVSSAAGFCLTDTKVVAGILILTFLLLLSSVFPGRVCLYAASVTLIIAVLAGFKEAAIAFSASAYWNFDTDNKSLFMMIPVPLLLIAASVSLPVNLAVLITGLIFVSSYISYMSRKSRQKEEELLHKYDEAREREISERNKRRTATDKSENDIYLATLEERNRIAREIHDNVGHILTRAIVQLKAVNVMNKDEKLKPYLESADESVNNAMTSIRKSVHELHDDSIDLSLGLNDLVRSLERRFDVKLITSIESPTSSEFKKEVLGIVKEALTNASKYSSGDAIRVEVIENNTFWRIYVHDNGKNPDRDYASRDYNDSGIGIENIMRRAASLEGSARIFSDKTGFTVLVTVPKEDRND